MALKLNWRALSEHELMQAGMTLDLDEALGLIFQKIDPTDSQGVGDIAGTFFDGEDWSYIAPADSSETTGNIDDAWSNWSTNERTTTIIEFIEHLRDYGKESSS